MSRFLEKFALNSEYALAEIRRSDRERAGEAAIPHRMTGLKFARPALASRRAVDHPAAEPDGDAMSELERWETRFAAPGYHFGTEPKLS